MLLRQAFAHCAKFLAAASRRSRGRVSVPVWLDILSDQLPVKGLVGRYLTNYLMGRRLIFRRPLGAFNNCHHAVPLHHRVLASISRSYSRPWGRLPTCYSPLRRFTQDIATFFSRDLHVLGTPPAFVLSQDQTLRCKNLKFCNQQRTSSY